MSEAQWYNMPTMTTGAGITNIQTGGAVNIEIAMEDMAQLMPMLQRSINSAIYAAKGRIEREALMLLPFRTGRLQESLQIAISGSGISVTLDPVSPEGTHYGRIVEIGAPPHEILGTDRPLHFWSRGKEVYAWSVSHPGYSGRGFLARLKELVIAIIRDEIGQAIAREFTRGVTLR